MSHYLCCCGDVDESSDLGSDHPAVRSSAPPIQTIHAQQAGLPVTQVKCDTGPNPGRNSISSVELVLRGLSRLHCANWQNNEPDDVQAQQSDHPSNTIQTDPMNHAVPEAIPSDPELVDVGSRISPM